MQSVNTSVWQGSDNTATRVLRQIRARFGDKVANDYDPKTNCFTFLGWKQRGYMVKKGEKAIRSITFIKDDNEDETVAKSYPKNVFLFCEVQVQKA